VVTRLVCLLALCAGIAHADEEVTIHADVTLQKRASARSTKILTIIAGETATVIATKGEWVKVHFRGNTGWIPESSMVALGDEEAEEPEDVAREEDPTSIAAAEDEEAPAEEAIDEPAVEAVVEEPPLERTIDIEVAAGLTVLTQGVRTTGGSLAVPDNYNLGVTAATLSLAGGYVHRIGEKLLAGAQLEYAYQKALPGIRLADPATGEPVITAFSVHHVDVRAYAGYRMPHLRGLVVFAGIGLRYRLFEVAGVHDVAANPGRIPSEVQLAPTIGGGVDFARITNKLGLRFAFDAFAAGAFTKQTPGLEDGTRANAAGASLSSTLTYHWRRSLDVRASYDLALVSYDFGAPDPMSERMHAGTHVARTDLAHTLTLGLAKGF
jgi:hypothetical protein